jgi:hypothetical protein
MTTGAPASDRVWDKRRTAKRERLAEARPHTDGKLIRPEALGQVLEAVIRPGGKVALEGDNQKQADFLSRTLAACDPGKLHDLHMLIGSVSRSEHLDLFEQGIAAKLDLAYAGPKSVRIAQLVADGTVSIGAVHTSKTRRKAKTTEVKDEMPCLLPKHPPPSRTRESQPVPPPILPARLVGLLPGSRKQRSMTFPPPSATGPSTWCWTASAVPWSARSCPGPALASRG